MVEAKQGTGTYDLVFGEGRDPVADPGTGAEMAPDDVPDCTQDDLALRLLAGSQTAPAERPGGPSADIGTATVGGDG